MSKAIREAEKRARERVAAKVKPAPIERGKSMRTEEEVWGKKARLEARMTTEKGFTYAALDLEVKVLKWVLKEIEELPFEE